MQWPPISTGNVSRSIISLSDAIQAWEDALQQFATIPSAEWPKRVGVYCPIHQEYEWDSNYSKTFLRLSVGLGTNFMAP